VKVNKNIGVVFVVLVTIVVSSPAFAARTVFDPWNLVKNHLSTKQLIKQVGITAKQLAQLKQIFNTTVRVLAEATWIHDAVTGKVDLKQQTIAYFRRRFDRWLIDNVPADLRGLYSAVVVGNIYAYLKVRRSVFPVFAVYELDPWNPQSTTAHYYQQAQMAYDASHAIAEQSYDESQGAMSDLSALHKDIDQKTVGGSMQLSNQIAVTNGMNRLRWERANAVHEARNAQQASRDIESLRQWRAFVGVTNPAAQFGYSPR